MDIYQEIIDAEERIRPFTLTTPLMESRELGETIEGKVFLKLESEQHTGSFKARGSLNKVLSLTGEEKERGIIAASTGNHALGIARALEISGCKGTVYLPENASQAKVDSLQKYPVDLKFHGKNSLEAELFAHQKAIEENKTWISPYNDPQVIGGQGTIGIEILSQQKHIDDILITVGGGGLISGIGSYIKRVQPSIKIMGCLPENAPEMSLSLEKGEVVSLDEPLDTLSDGSAGGLEENSITFPICQDVVDETHLVSESEIASAIRWVASKHHKMIEGAAGVVVASLIKNKEKYRNRNVALIICGANISIEKFNGLFQNDL